MPLKSYASCRSWKNKSHILPKKKKKIEDKLSWFQRRRAEVQVLILESWPVPSKQPPFHKNILWLFFFTCFRILSWAWVPQYCHHYHMSKSVAECFLQGTQPKVKQVATERKAIYRTQFAYAGARQLTERECREVIFLYLAWSNSDLETMPHPMSTRWWKPHSYVGDIWEKRQLSPGAFQLLLKTKREIQWRRVIGLYTMRQKPSVSHE